MQNVLLVELSSKLSKPLGARPPNQWSVLVAQLDELLPEFFFLGARSDVATLEEAAAALP